MELVLSTSVNDLGLEKEEKRAGLLASRLIAGVKSKEINEEYIGIKLGDILCCVSNNR